MIFSEQAMPRATKSTNLLDLVAWARRYNQSGRLPQPWERRFLIAAYQLDNIDCPEHRNEAKAAFCLNTLLCVEDLCSKYKISGMEIHVEHELDMVNCERFRRSQALTLIAKALRHCVYGSEWNRSQRAKRRFKPEEFVRICSSLFQGVLFSIPMNERKTAIQQATAILCEEVI